MAAEPISEAATAARGSAVLRQEQDRESEVALCVDCDWCIEHACASPWSHVHSTLTMVDDIVEHNAAGIETRRHK